MLSINALKELCKEIEIVTGLKVFSDTKMNPDKGCKLNYISDTEDQGYYLFEVYIKFPTSNLLQTHQLMELAKKIKINNSYMGYKENGDDSFITVVKDLDISFKYALSNLSRIIPDNNSSSFTLQLQVFNIGEL